MEKFLQPSEGENYWVLGDLYSFKLTGKDSNGALTVIEQVIQPQGGPPPHIHHRESETFYVVDGKFAFLSGEKEQVFETGSYVHIPGGTLHTFRNIDNKPGRLMVMISPAGLEDFFYAIGSPKGNSEQPPPFDPSIMPRLLKLAGEFHMEVRVPG